MATIAKTEETYSKNQLADVLIKVESSILYDKTLNRDDLASLLRSVSVALIGQSAYWKKLLAN